MPSTLWGFVSLLVKVGLVAGVMLWGIRTLPMVCAQAASPGGGFAFVVMGDLPYTTRDVDQDQHFERLIAIVNKLQPAFSIHIGDIKSGSTRCDDATFEKIKAYFMTFQKPLVYVPGDNEWTDCHRKSNGPFDPIERLAKIRTLFFPQAVSWGQQTLSVTRQSDVSAFPKMVENARWVMQNIVFVTVHVVGSNNNLRQNRDAALEFLDRNQANIAWINEAFAVAKSDNVQGLVLAMHANLDFHAKHGDGRIPCCSLFSPYSSPKTWNPCNAWAKAPHPNLLPLGEGTQWHLSRHMESLPRRLQQASEHAQFLLVEV